MTAGADGRRTVGTGSESLGQRHDLAHELAGARARARGSACGRRSVSQAVREARQMLGSVRASARVRPTRRSERDQPPQSPASEPPPACGRLAAAWGRPRQRRTSQARLIRIAAVQRAAVPREAGGGILSSMIAVSRSPHRLVEASRARRRSGSGRRRATRRTAPAGRPAARS